MRSVRKIRRIATHESHTALRADVHAAQAQQSSGYGFPRSSSMPPPPPPPVTVRSPDAFNPFAPPPPAAETRLTAKVYFVVVDEAEPVGPVSADQIARGIRAGKVPSHATVRRQDEVFWSDLLDVADIMEALKTVSHASETPPAAKSPALTIKQFLVWVDDSAPVGPVSADQIARGIRAGKVPSHASVQRVGEFFAADVLDEPEIVEALKLI